MVYSSSLFIDLTTTSMNTRTPTFRAYSAYSFSTARFLEETRAEADEGAHFMQPCAICARLREKEIIVFPQYRIRSYYQMVRCNGDLAQRQSIRMCPCSYHMNPSFPSQITFVQIGTQYICCDKNVSRIAAHKG